MKNRYRYMMVIMTLLAILSALYTYTRVNDEIAVHWGRNGEADGYAPKQLLLLFPFLIPAFDLLLKLLFRLEPRKRNMLKSSSGYAVIRLVIGAILCVCTIFTCLEALYPKKININIVAPFMVGIMIMIIGNVLPKIHSNYIIGIRNPWTLENEDIWRKTQRLSGRLWFGGGSIDLYSRPCFTGLVFHAADFHYFPDYSVTESICFLFISTNAKGEST